MECEICHKSHNAKRRPFLCAVDARNQLYEPRLAHATALMKNAKIEEHINSVLSGAGDTQATDEPAGRGGSLEALKSDEKRAVDRTEQIIAQAELLHTEIENARKDMDERRKVVARRKSDLTSLSSGLEARRLRQIEELERSIGMTRYKWNREYDTMAATRSLLCQEAAKLYGLKRMKKGGSYRYEICGVEIIEPAALNAASPEVISTGLARIAHILKLASRYLAIRLPAEITLPHKDYPRPTIMSLSSSYAQAELPFPGTSNVPSSNLSGPKDGGQSDGISRPRPLFVDKPLPLLSKEDPATYGAVLDGVALLAYNIAWACCSQGVPIGEKTSFDDVSNIGRNLYNLLIGTQRYDNPRGRILAKTPEVQNENLGEIGSTTSMMGRYSHGTAHTPVKDDFVRNFKLPNPKLLTERLKNKLSSSNTMPEWEVLQEDAWEVDDHLEAGVLNRGGRHNVADMRPFGVESIATVRGGLDETLVDLRASSSGRQSAEKGRTTGMNGWTKLKTR